MAPPLPPSDGAGPPGGFRRTALIVGGVLLLVIGIAGWLIPVIPGFPALFAGVAMLALAVPWVRRARDRFRQWIRRRPPSAAPGAGPRTPG